MIIEPSHFEYLVIQRGEVSDKRHNFKAWKTAYETSLMDIFTSIHPVLPQRCGSVLDIGGGLGGIDLHLVSHYGPDTQVCVLDGLDCPPKVNWHNQPFNNAEVTKDFHRKNGNENIEVVFPRPDPPRKFDLIVSFAAYCFHILPCDYFEVVAESMHENTVLIFDVRRQSPDWLKECIVMWGKPIVLQRREKFVRLAFRCDPSLSFAAVGQ
jgi:methyltransferase family protein